MRNEIRKQTATTGGWALTLLAVGLAGCGDDAGVGAAQAGEGEVHRRVINVEVLPLEAESFRERIRITGTVQANRDVVVSAEEGGVIRELLVEKGAAVREGDPLVRIDDRLIRAQADEAEARAALARETWERRRRLYEADGVGTELAYLEARYQAEQAEASLASLRERLDRTVIRAPLTGILDAREVEVGTMVSAGSPVVRIVQIDPVKVTGGVPERYAGDVAPGDGARISFDVLRGESYEGDVTFVGSTVNPANRTFPVEVVLPNPGRVIKSEMVANLELTRRVLEAVVVVPQEAVVRVEEGFVAFVAEEEDGETVARARRLVLGPAQRNLAVVEEGLEAGDRLVVVGQKQVANGDRIQVVRTWEDRERGGDR